jgi:hypothetical protein
MGAAWERYGMCELALRLLDLEYEGTMILWHVMSFTPNDKVSSQRTESVCGTSVITTDIVVCTSLVRAS